MSPEPPTEAYICELDGPPRSSFDVPLDYFTTANGEIEPESTAGAVRLTQHIEYVSYRVVGPTIADVVVKSEEFIEALRQTLKAKGGGILWWRWRPRLEKGISGGKPAHKITLRVGTSPSLSYEHWACLLARFDDTREKEKSSA